jgi:hypothetical protein
MSNKLMYRLGLEDLTENEPSAAIEPSETVESQLLEESNTSKEMSDDASIMDTAAADIGTLGSAAAALESALASGRCSKQAIAFANMSHARIAKRWGINPTGRASMEEISEDLDDGDNAAQDKEVNASLEGIRDTISKLTKSFTAGVKKLMGSISDWWNWVRNAAKFIRERAKQLEAAAGAADFDGGEEVKIKSKNLTLNGMYPDSKTLVANLKTLDKAIGRICSEEGVGSLGHLKGALEGVIKAVVKPGRSDSVFKTISAARESIYKALVGYGTQVIGRTKEVQAPGSGSHIVRGEPLLGDVYMYYHFEDFDMHHAESYTDEEGNSHAEILTNSFHDMVEGWDIGLQRAPVKSGSQTPVMRSLNVKESKEITQLAIRYCDNIDAYQRAGLKMAQMVNDLGREAEESMSYMENKDRYQRAFLAGLPRGIMALWRTAVSFNHAVSRHYIAVLRDSLALVRASIPKGASV